MATDLSNVLNPVKKFIDYLGERPGISERNRNILYILSFLTVFIQPVVSLIVPESTARRLTWMVITYAFSLCIALIFGQVISIRRWLIYLAPFFTVPVLVGTVYTYVFYTSDAYRVASGILVPGRSVPYTAVYTTNGRVLESQVYRRSLPTGPDQFIRLKFQLLCTGVEENCNAGWIIGNIRSTLDPNSVQELVFEIRGAQGGEVIGVALKDRGETFSEDRIFDIGKYVSGGSGITTDWESARIPLALFPHVNLAKLDVISFFVDARYYPYPIIDFDIANVRFE